MTGRSHAIVLRGDGTQGGDVEPSSPDRVDAIDVCEHHCIDFDAVHAAGVRAVVIRAGRGTRQDSRWIEHVRAARTSGLGVASYWHLYPSRTSAHHQAELWAAAVRGAASQPFAYGHWADISSPDGFEPFDLGRYVASFLRRADELLDQRVGVFASDDFWRRHVYFDATDRDRWRDADHGAVAPPSFGIRTTPADRGGPGRHRVVARDNDEAVHAHAWPVLVDRGSTESLQDWRARWVRTSEIAQLQTALNSLGAALVVDGVYGPATDNAVRTFGLLCRRDGVESTLGGLSVATVTTC